MSDDDIKLPPLPGPDHHESKTNRKLYIPDQMQCYARAAIQGDRASRVPSPQGDAEDAARYRWLRERWGRLAESYVGPVVQAIQVLDDRDIQDGIAWDVDPESLDRAIDAARSTPATEKGE